MSNLISRWLDILSEHLAARKGLLPFLGILLIIVNFVLSFFPGLGFISTTNLFLHLGMIVSILGFMLAWAL